MHSLEDFKTKEEWDKFHQLQADKPYEWCAELPEFKTTLIENIFPKKLTQTRSKLRILVPGCGISDLSASLCNVGFNNITNVDYSEVAIHTMKSKNESKRRQMEWQVMDMTCLSFGNGSFDVVVDKGGLDALMAPSLSPISGNLYLSEVKRVLRGRGKYIILTQAEPETVDILLKKFRLGWAWGIHPIEGMKSFMITMERCTVYIDTLSEYFFVPRGNKAQKVMKALEKEEKIRENYVPELQKHEIVYTVEELIVGVNLEVSHMQRFLRKHGRRTKVILGEPGVSRCSYYGILLESKSDSGKLEKIVIISQDANGILREEDEQWEFLASEKAPRLLLVFLDSSNSFLPFDDVQCDLTPLVKQLAEGLKFSKPTHTPSFKLFDGIKLRKKLFEDKSDVTGPILVEDVIYKTCPDEDRMKDRVCRRLIFKGAKGAEFLVQSEALLSKKDSVETEGETRHEALVETEKESKVDASAKKAMKNAKKKAKRKAKKEALVALLSQEESVEIEKKTEHEALSSSGEIETEARQEAPVESEKEAKLRASVKKPKKNAEKKASSDEMEVNHDFLASPYHNEIVNGIIFFSSHLLFKFPLEPVLAVILGLGTGVLPMYLKKNLPSNLRIRVFELDRSIVNVARNFFGFKEDSSLQVQNYDGIEALKDLADIEEAPKGFKPDILIVDLKPTDTSACSSGLSCPGEAYVRRSFLLIAKESLSEDGMFIMNLVSRSSALKLQVFSRLRKVFSCVFRVEIKKDVSEIIFAFKYEVSLEELMQNSEVYIQLAASLGFRDGFNEFIRLIKDASLLCHI